MSEWVISDTAMEIKRGGVLFHYKSSVIVLLCTVLKCLCMNIKSADSGSEAALLFSLLFTPLLLASNSPTLPRNCRGSANGWDTLSRPHIHQSLQQRVSTQSAKGSQCARSMIRNIWQCKHRARQPYLQLSFNRKRREWKGKAGERGDDMQQVAPAAFGSGPLL